MQASDWLAGLKKGIFVALSYIPLGLAAGFALEKVGFSALNIAYMSLSLFSGAGQFMTSSMVEEGASILSILLLNVFLSLRMALMTSSLSRYVRGQSPWFLTLFAHTTADEAFGINIYEFENDPDWTPNKAMATNLICFSTWVVATVIGALLGSQLSIPMVVVNYVMTAMFISFMISNFVSREYVVSGLLAGILAVILKLILNNNLGLVFAALIASFVGFYLSDKKAGGFDD